MSKYLKEISYICLLSLNISDLFAGFLVLITYFRMKSEKEEETIKEIKPKKSNNIKLIYNDLSKKRNKHSLLLLLSIIELTGRSTDFLFILLINNEIVVSNDTIIWIISIDILSRILFSSIILKTRIYLHHIVAFLIFIIGFLPMTIWGIIAMAEKKHGFYYYF